MTPDASANATPDVAGDAARELAVEGGTCPHCGGLTRVEEHPRFRFVCAACGGPRIAAPDRRALEGPRVVEELRRANGTRRAAFTWRVAATALGACGTLVALLGAALAAASIPVAVALLALTVGLFAPAIVFARRARRLSNDALRQVFVAWESAAYALVHAEARDGNVPSGAELAKGLGTTEADVERMMTLLNVDDRVRIEVKDAEIRYLPSTATEETPPDDDDDHEEAPRADERRR